MRKRALFSWFVLGLLLVLYGCYLPSPPGIPAFPWPPPQASAWAEIDPALLRNPSDEMTLLRDVDQRLSKALVACGYGEKSYFSAGPDTLMAPDGFAMVMRLEQINADGTPKEGQDRWATDLGPLQTFSLRAYLRALFTANPGHYRIIVFIVTPHAFSQADTTVSRDEAMGWLIEGQNRLDPLIGALAYSPAYQTTALIYEFEQPRRGEEADFVVSSLLIGRVHLEQADLINALGQ